MKCCFKCGLEKPTVEFYRHPMMADGHLNKCKDCTKRDVAAHRELHLDRIRDYDRTRAKAPRRRAHIERMVRREQLAHPERSAVRQRSRKAARRGQLARPVTCEACGAAPHKIEIHHLDYSDHMRVLWLCKPCHWRADRDRRQHERLNHQGYVG